MILLLTGAIAWSNEQKLELINMGHEIIYVQDERIPLKEQGINPSIIEGIICNGLFLYNDIKDFKNLRYIQLTSAGYDRVPMDYIKKNKIEIYNSRGVYSIPMAEYAVCGVLQLYKKSPFFYDNQRQHLWEKNRNILELFGKTVCIIGCGSVGTECAKRFKAFGCHVVGVDLYPRMDVHYDSMENIESLDVVLPESDVVVLTLPLLDETRHLINRKRLKLLKKTAILVNISRGVIVDTDALIDVLPNLGGAVLDVFEEEPLPKNSLLWDMENIIVTPHNSFVSNNNYYRLHKLIIKNLRR